MKLTLAPQTEARLRNVAAQRGLPPEIALDAVLAEAEGDFDSAAAEVRAGMDDFAAGRWVSLEAMEADSRSWRREDHAS